jgi:hypothetical protein
MNNRVIARAVSGTNVFVGGGFTTAGGTSASYVAQWNGSSWSPLGSGMNGGVIALAASGANLYAGGDFTTAGGVPANYVAQWNGSSWLPLGSCINNNENEFVNTLVDALLVSANRLFVGGDFGTAGTNVSAYVAEAIIGPPTIAWKQTGTSFRLAFQTVVSQSYTIQQTTNLAGDNWIYYTNFIGDGSVDSITVPTAANMGEFFRAREP